jgi:hypothetical protein
VWIVAGERVDGCGHSGSDRLTAHAHLAEGVGGSVPVVAANITGLQHCEAQYAEQGPTLTAAHIP